MSASPTGTVGSLIRPFVAICLLRLRPQDLPASRLLLALALGAYLLTSMLVLSADTDPRRAMVGAIADTTVLSLMTFALLSAFRRQSRLPQTLAALAGTGAVLTLLAFPLVSWVHAINRDEGDPGALVLLLTVLVFWSITVVAHILRHALSTQFLWGVVAAMGFYALSISIVSRLA